MYGYHFGFFARRQPSRNRVITQAALLLQSSYQVSHLAPPFLNSKKQARANACMLVWQTIGPCSQPRFISVYALIHDLEQSSPLVDTSVHVVLDVTMSFDFTSRLNVWCLINFQEAPIFHAEGGTSNGFTPKPYALLNILPLERR